MKSCSVLDPGACAELYDDLTGTAEAAMNPWDTICLKFIEAAQQLIGAFADAFTNFPNVDVSSGGVVDAYGISMGIGILVAALLLLVQTARTALTHDGGALAEALVGLGKAAVAFLLTLTLTATALVAADELTGFIVDEMAGSSENLAKKMVAIMDTQGGQAVPTLMMIIALIAIVLIVVLWFELLLRNAAIAVLIASSPIAAAGMVSGATKQWWSKLVAATLQLIALKPIIALIFCIGFSLVDEPDGSVGSYLAGLLVLLLATIAWPVMMRFMPFAHASVGGGAGVGAAVGYASGRASGRGSGIASVSPEHFGQAAEARTMQAASQRTQSASAAANSSSSSGSAVAGGGGGPWLAAIAAGLQGAQKASNSLARRSEAMAGHAGIDGANPYAHPAGIPAAQTNLSAALAQASTGAASAPRQTDAPASVPPQPEASPPESEPPPAPPPPPGSSERSSPPAVQDLREPKRFDP